MGNERSSNHGLIVISPCCLWQNKELIYFAEDLVCVQILD